MTTLTPLRGGVVFFAGEARTRQLGQVTIDARKRLIGWWVDDAAEPLRLPYMYREGNGTVLGRFHADDTIWAYSADHHAVIASGVLLSAGLATDKERADLEMGNFTGILRIEWRRRENIPYEYVLTATGLTDSQWLGYARRGGVMPSLHAREEEWLEESDHWGVDPDPDEIDTTDEAVLRLREAGAEFTRARQRRQEAILAGHDAGLGLATIADAVGLTHEAVRRMIRASGR